MIVRWEASGAVERPEPADYVTAMNAYRAGDCQSAIPLLSAVARSFGKANLVLGQCYFETESYLKAIEPLRSYIAEFPADYRGAILLARTYLKIDRNEDGIKTLTNYTSQNPQDLNARAQLGRIYLEAGNKDQSASTLRDVLQQAPENPSALLGLALNASADQHWQDAANYASRVIQTAPEQAEAYRILGDAYFHQAQYEKALGPYNEAFRLMPLDFSTEKALAKCYAKLGKWSDVAHVLGSGTVAEANDLELTELARQALQDKPQLLESYCRAAIALNPMNTVAHRVLAQSLDSSKEVERAKVEYLEILKLEQRDPDPQIHYHLGKIFEAEGNIAEARKHYEAASRSSRAISEMHLALGRAYLAINDAPDAKAALAKVGPPDNETTEFKIMNAEINLRTSDVNGASATVTALLSGDPNNKKLLDLAAEIAAKQGKYAEAAGFLERLFQADPENNQIRYRLVTLYTDHPELKGDAKAMEFLKGFAAKQEQDPEGYLLLANLYRRNKDFANAKTYFDLGLAKVPNPIPAKFSWAYSSYASLYYAQGNLQEALVQQLKAIEINPNDNQAQFYLAIMYIKAGNADGVDQVVSRLETRDPDRAAQLLELARRSRLPLKSQVTQ
ncbi:MAG: tetratricopeptide repeat protein [Bryobacteraceae bacterium]